MSSTADRLEEFFRHRPDDIRVDVHHLPHAREDFPPEAQARAAVIFDTPAGHGFRHRLFDVLENAVAAAYGHLECERLFRFLAQYAVAEYTYEISPWLSRGERPDRGKIAELYREGYRATIDLCAETPQGDAAYIAAAGLTGRLETHHIAVIDAMPPTVEQVAGLLTTLGQLRAAGVRAYLHCEAGKGRTGVMVAAVRMASMGWSTAHALTEARHFGLWTPDQIAFVERLGAELTANFDARAAARPEPYATLAGFPTLRPGSVEPTARQLSMTLAAAVAARGRGVGA